MFTTFFSKMIKKMADAHHQNYKANRRTYYSDFQYLKFFYTSFKFLFFNTKGHFWVTYISSIVFDKFNFCIRKSFQKVNLIIIGILE